MKSNFFLIRISLSFYFLKKKLINDESGEGGREGGKILCLEIGCVCYVIDFELLSNKVFF